MVSSTTISSQSSNRDFVPQVSPSLWFGGGYLLCSLGAGYALWEGAQKKLPSDASEKVIPNSIAFIGSLSYLTVWAHSAKMCDLGAYVSLIWKVGLLSTALSTALNAAGGIQTLAALSGRMEVLTSPEEIEASRREQKKELFSLIANVSLCSWAGLSAFRLANPAVLSTILGGGCVFWVVSILYPFYTSGQWAAFQKKIDSLVGLR